MKAIILAAGLGTRLRPMTDSLPKPLLPVGGRPVIVYNLLLLKRYGITEAIINLHYQADKIIRALGDGTQYGMTIRYSREPEILGTAGGVRKAARWLAQGSFLVVNGDILVDVNLDRLVEFHYRKRALVTMVLRKDPDPDAWGAVEVDEQGRIRQLLGKLNACGERLTTLMFTGVQVMQPRALDYIPARGFASLIDTYLAMLRQGERVLGYPMRGYWLDIGTAARYREANEGFRRKKIRLSYVR